MDKAMYMSREDQAKQKVHTSMPDIEALCKQEVAVNAVLLTV